MEFLSWKIKTKQKQTVNGILGSQLFPIVVQSCGEGRDGRESLVDAMEIRCLAD